MGIPCIVDRVVQMAAVLVLEPIFEADLQPEQYAYRPERSALDAVREVQRRPNREYGGRGRAICPATSTSIPHAELLKSLARRSAIGACWS